MINRRVQRPSRAAERLQQFCLNSSAGIDCTKPHNDVKSVLYSKNLVVNTDGSVSLRKPITLRTMFSAVVKRVIPLPNEAYVVICDNGFTILDSTCNPISFKILWNDMLDTAHTQTVPNGGIVSSSDVDLMECFYTDLNTGVLLSNCKVSGTAVRFFEDDTFTNSTPFVNANLYDDPEQVPRMVRIYYDTLHKNWVFQIVQPLTGVYRNLDSGESYLDSNTLLDNPFAVRDEYHTSVPGATCIRAYVYSSTPEQYASDDVLLTPVESFAKYAIRQNELWEQEVIFPIEYGYTFGKFHMSLSNSNRFPRVTHTVTLEGDAELYIADSYPYNASTAASLVENCSLKVEFTNNTNSELTLSIPTDACYQISAQLQNSEGSVTPSAKVELWPDFSSEIKLQPFETHTVTLNLDQEMLDILCRTVNRATDSIRKSFVIGNGKYPVRVSVYCDYDITSAIQDTVPQDVTVSELTESVKLTRYRGVITAPLDETPVLLKAFVKVPDDVVLYCSWRHSTDGVVWEDILPEKDSNVTVTEPNADPIKDVSVSESVLKTTADFEYAMLVANSPEDTLDTRADCVSVPYLHGVYKFKLCSLKQNTETSKYEVESTYADLEYVSNVGNAPEFEEYDRGNTALGQIVYSNNRVYSYGVPALENTISYTYPGELVFQMANYIDLNSGDDASVTTVVRWRNCLILATEKALYLSENTSDTFFTKTVNTAVGIPKHDARCCVPVLNGVIFKSNNKVYQLYPNVYSDDATVLNVTEISQNVNHILDTWEASESFAFSTESEYVLMHPDANVTQCLRYNYTTRVWSFHTYDVLFSNVKIAALDDIRLWGVGPKKTICEFVFDSSYTDFMALANISYAHQQIPYGDFLKANIVFADGVYARSYRGILDWIRLSVSVGASVVMSPIEFELDTGQKTDTISTTKQFVESKIVVATDDSDAVFPMQLLVHVDGDPHVTTRDISTDAPFWKDKSTGGVLNTTFSGLSAESDTLNTLRQLIVRYSGKGKSVRHILKGSSICNFKIYETYVRYKLLNVKQ